MPSFQLLTHSVAGGIPVGCLITTSESKETISTALGLYKEMFPSDAFYGRGQRGPAVFMTDDCEAEQQSLKSTFPEATCLLCKFHFFQALWRYLWDAKHGISKEDRPHLLVFVKNMMYACSENDLKCMYANFCQDSVVLRYRNYADHVDKLYSRRDEWALWLRTNLPVRGNDTNNYVEAAMRILKDHIFERFRAYSPLQLLDFILVRMQNYYERRLTDLANGRLDVMLSKRYIPDQGNITPEMISLVGDAPGLYQVESETTVDHFYSVDMVNGMCTCHVGLNGALCKHQNTVYKHHDVKSFNFFPVRDETMRQHLFYLASGIEVSQLPENWFCPLGASTATEQEDQDSLVAEPAMDVGGHSDPTVMETCNEHVDIQFVLDGI